RRRGARAPSLPCNRSAPPCPYDRVLGLRLAREKHGSKLPSTCARAASFRCREERKRAQRLGRLCGTEGGFCGRESLAGGRVKNVPIRGVRALRGRARPGRALEGRALTPTPGS